MLVVIAILSFVIVSFGAGSVPKPSTNRIIEGFVVPEDSIHFKFTLRVISHIYETFQVSCGGTLISPNYVLTAAHCVEKAAIVQVIQHDPISKRDSTFEVSDVIPHPHFNPEAMTHDFAILKLALPINNFFVCLPNDDQDQLVGANLTISGWGRTSPDVEESSDVLKSTFVTGISNSDCSEIYAKATNKSQSHPFSLDPTIICVDGRLTHSSPCKGDSGGPATTTIGGKITLIGVASYGIKDEDGSYCSPKLPSAYARVSTQLDWIQKNSDVSQWECNKE